MPHSNTQTRHRSRIRQLPQKIYLTGFAAGYRSAQDFDLVNRIQATIIRIFSKIPRSTVPQASDSQSQKRTLRTVTISDGLFSIGSCNVCSNRRKNRQTGRLGSSAASVYPRRINDLDKQRHGETIGGEWTMSYPVTLYFSSAIPLQRPPGYPTPLTPTRSFRAVCW
jgi:ATP-dependent protease HslVU (ClpYQ) peptidase subunit